MPSGSWKTRDSISARLIVWIIGFSSFLAIFASAVQLFLDYRQDIDRVHRDLAHVQVVNLKPLAQSLWEVAEEPLSRLRPCGCYRSGFPS